jgi:hypothetical protein
MAQHYKLRLGDGTVLSVDLDGLKTWAADSRATVQAVGSWRWQPLREILAEQEAAAKLARALIPPTPRQGATPPPPVAPPSPQVTEPPLSEPPFGGLGFGEPAFSEPAVAAAPRPSLQALADDPVPSRFGDPPAEAAPGDMPIIRMKPLDDEPVYPAAWATTRREDDGEDEFAAEGPRHDRLEGPLLTVLEKVGGFLSRCLRPLTPLAARLTSERTELPGPRGGGGGAASVPRRSAPGDSAPRILTLADETAARRGVADEPRDAADKPGLYARVSEWMSGVGARLRRTDREEPPAPKREPARPSASPLAPERQPLKAPPPLSQLPALRFVESRESPETADVYEGGEPSAAAYYLQLVWLWTKRLLITGALVAALGYAALERDTWFPKAAELGQRLFAQVDQWLSGRDQQQRRALADAAGRLPGLAPETITLIFSRSPTGVADPGDVFQLAREAADRGLAALTPAEAEELQALERELLAKLSRREAEAVREYDRTRARRVIFPFENPPVMNLVALGVRGLPAERRERLQALTKRAVDAGIDRSETSRAPRAAR